MQFNHKLFCITLALIPGTASAISNLETTRKEIVATLNREAPNCVAEFNSFFKKYDAVVFSFFDTKNNEPLKAHIESMESELQLLQNVCNDARYRSVHSILCEYHAHLKELVTLLKQYVGSHDTVSLAWKVRRFKVILPKTVKQQGDVSLFWGLYHRLRCGQ